MKLFSKNWENKMWYTDYIKEIKRQLAEVYKFVPSPKSTEHEFIFFDNIPDGEYPMIIEGKVDYVKIINGQIHCLNFESTE